MLRADHLTEARAALDDEPVDVIVVGGGGSGLSAAVAAARSGARTVLLEKADHVGGTTILSVGSFSAAGTRAQRRHGIVDSPADFLEDMYAFQPESDDPRLRALLAREAGPTLDWLEDLGVVFAGPFREPPHRVARMHNVIPNSRMYRDRLLRAAQLARVRIETNSRVLDAVVDPDGRVAGVEYERLGQRRSVRASGGVVLASGDISGDAGLRRRYFAPALAASVPLNPTNTGDGQLLGARLGAELCAMSLVNGPQLRFPAAPKGSLPQRLPTWPWLARLGAFALYHAPRRLLGPIVRSALVSSMQAERELFIEGAILVNAAGDRFCDEVSSSASLAMQPGSRGYVILDSRIAAHFDRPPHHISTAPGIAFAYFSDYVSARPDIVRRAADSASLAALLGIDPERLKRAVATAPALRPPLYALGPIVANLTVSEGGLRVDETLRVLRPDGSPIVGLYAAGGCGQSGLHLKGHGHHIGWAHTSGRLAGTAAATRAR
jgi:fumarate reductase flavoprotein subunit